TSYGNHMFVRNTWMNGSWGEEERTPGFQFTPGKRFHLAIRMNPDNFGVWIDGILAGEFRFRTPTETINTVYIHGDVQIKNIYLKDHIDDKNFGSSRRASIAVSPVDGHRQNGLGLSEINRSPRHSIIPDVALMQTKDEMCEESFEESINKSPRHSLYPDSALSPRNSLMSDCQRSPRHSLVPSDHRSPRNSLVRESALSPRNFATPDQHNRSPRNSLVPDQVRSPRHSLTPESSTYGSRLNISEHNRSPRNSLLPDGTRCPRQIVVSLDGKPWNTDEAAASRSPRHSLTPVESNKSPRGSAALEAFSYRISPRGSITGGSTLDYGLEQRLPRGSIGPDNGQEVNRSPRGSIAARNNIGSEIRSSRGSLTLTFQEPPGKERRASADNATYSKGKSSSPSYRSASKGNINSSYGVNSTMESSGSRRASSSVSQVSGDEQRRLFGDQKYVREMGEGLNLSLTLTTYGSVAYQLKDANLEASGTCDFVCKALGIVNKTVMVTILLVCLSVVPLIMLIMGK
uniref:Galectin n=1 Tax=Dendroctonus ponderosae TaxID=77166 RepID=A0AAR5P0U0_DENPD